MDTDTRKVAMKHLQAQSNLRTVQQRNIRTAKLYQEQSIMKTDSPLLPNIKMRTDTITRKWNMISRVTRLMKKFMNKPYQHI